LEACKLAMFRGRRVRPPDHNLEIAAVIDAIIGHHRPILATNEIQAVLNCDRNLVRRHLAAREYLSLTQLRGNTPGNQRLLVLRDSFEAFLRRRRIC
jgi:hypothetical protein